MISIITPVYNVERFLPCMIESVLAQLEQDWELLLIDDGSTDTLGSLCDDYVKRYKRIKVIHQEPHFNVKLYAKKMEELMRNDALRIRLAEQEKVFGQVLNKTSV